MKMIPHRRYDIDWLRVLGVFLLVPFHAAQIFILIQIPSCTSRIQSTAAHLPEWQGSFICGTCLCCLSFQEAPPISRSAYVR